MGKRIKKQQIQKKRLYEIISGITWIFLGLSFKYHTFKILFAVVLTLEILFVFKNEEILSTIKDGLFDSSRKADTVTLRILMLILMFFLIIPSTVKISLINMQMIVAILLGCISILHALVFIYYEKNSSCIEECKCISEE
ncbi:TPA: hypothetical protein KPJ62_003708 [Clostridioides difficile]|nr:hypothetical protein [Clostridioides difficile]